MDILFKIPKKDIRYDNVRAKIIALLLFTQSREMERGKFINANSPVSNTDQNDYRRFMQMAIYIRALEIMIEQDMAAIK